MCNEHLNGPSGPDADRPRGHRLARWVLRFGEAVVVAVLPVLLTTWLAGQQPCTDPTGEAESVHVDHCA